MDPARRLRNRLIGIARRARGQWERLRPRRSETLDFDAVHRRLQLLVGAMFGQHIGDGLVARTRATNPTERAIVLPPSLPESSDAMEQYRLLTIEQAARVARGTRANLPYGDIERDLYMIIEGASIDAELVERAPRLSAAIVRMRKAELRRRRDSYVASGARPVEALLQELLAADPSSTLQSIPRTTHPTESAAEARRLANAIRRNFKRRDVYGAIEWVPLWDDDSVSGRVGVAPLPLRDNDLPREKGSSSGDAYNPGALVQAPSPDGQASESPPQEDNASDSSESDASAAAAGASADSETGPQTQGGNDASEAGAGALHEDDLSEPVGKTPALPKGPAPGGTQYPEWLDRFKRLEQRYTTVFDVNPAEGDGTWARQALRDHAGIVRQLRDRFSLLRARRLRLRAQRSGEEIDLDACVNALVDRRLNRSPSDRLYQSTRASRHALAITILVDVSGSTRELLPNGQSILDVERLSLVLASEALSSLGDPYSILAFSGNSRHDVRVATVKGFAERDLSGMHRRVSKLEAGDNTRLGAAVRHATSLLLQQHAHRHVLLILSDGKPHDVDWYWADGAVEDSRIALFEARAAGVHSFCITVDSKEADYLPHLFGDGRYWVLADPTELPKALIRLIDTILTG